MGRRRILLGSCSESVIPSNQIWYTTMDGSVVTPYAQDVFGANIVSNIYEDDKGIITFDGVVTTIGNFAFRFCDSLESVTIGNSVTTIVGRAFYGCSNLTSITIGNSLTAIGVGVFENCTSLTSVTIPDSVTEIGSSAFYGCSNLTSVYCKVTTPPTLGRISVFEDNASGRKIYVPAESVEAYKTASYWSDYADSIVGYNF